MAGSEKNTDHAGNKVWQCDALTMDGNDCFLPTAAHFAFQIHYFPFLSHISWSHFRVSNLDKSATQVC